MGTWDKMRLDICETLNEMEKPVMGGAVAEGDLHSSILHNITCEDKEKGGDRVDFLPWFWGSFWSLHLGVC